MQVLNLTGVRVLSCVEKPRDQNRVYLPSRVVCQVASALEARDMI